MCHNLEKEFANDIPYFDLYEFSKGNKDVTRKEVDAWIHV